MGATARASAAPPLRAGARQRAKHKAEGRCPGCHFDHDGSPFIFCFECRQEQSEKAKRWYRANRAYAPAAKWQREQRTTHSKPSD